MTALILGLLILAGALFVLHTVATEHFLYWRFWWYDIMMHFLGGVVVGGLAAWGIARLVPTISRSHLLYGTLVGLLVIGIGWEVFEYLVGFYTDQPNIVGDTTLDLIMDTLGALFAYGIISSITTLPANKTFS